jgi:hypothetical protein
MMMKGEKMAPRTMIFMRLIVAPRGLRFWIGRAGSFIVSEESGSL